MNMIIAFIILATTTWHIAIEYFVYENMKKNPDEIILSRFWIRVVVFIGVTFYLIFACRFVGLAFISILIFFVTTGLIDLYFCIKLKKIKDNFKGESL